MSFQLEGGGPLHKPEVVREVFHDIGRDGVDAEYVEVVILYIGRYFGVHNRQIQQHTVSPYEHPQFHFLKLPQIRMLTDFPPQPPRRANIYTNVMLDGQSFRLVARQHQNTIKAIHIWQSVWVIFNFAMLAILIHTLLMKIAPTRMSNKLPLMVFGSVGIGMAWSCWLMVKYWLSTGNMAKLTVFNFSFFVIACSLMLAFNCHLLKVIAFISIFVEIVGSLLFLSNRSQLMGKSLVMLQLLMIIYKLDGSIQMGWMQVYFGTILGLMFGAISFVSMGIFLAVNNFYFGEPLGSIKSIGLGFIGLHSLSLMFCCSTPVSQVLFNVPCWILALLTAICNSVNIYYNHRFLTQISLFLCQIEPVKSFDQIITITPLNFQNYKDQAFIKKSDNWYVKQKVQPSESYSLAQESIKPQLQQGEQEEDTEKCLICLEREPIVIWNPCGHLTVCRVCCEKMFEKKNSNCLLCKQIPEEIYFVFRPAEKTDISMDGITESGSSKRIADPSPEVEDLKKVLHIGAAYAVTIC